MKKRVWRFIGLTAYWLLLPLIYVYAAATKPRARVLLIHANCVLVVKNWLGAGGWALPGGGIERGESPAEAGIREVKEELGFSVAPGALRFLGTHTTTERGGLKSKYQLFVVDLSDKPKLTIKSDEIIDYAWVPVAELMSAQKGVGNTVKQSVGVWLDNQNLVS